MMPIDPVTGALKPWDGRWFVPKATGPQLLNIHQFTAKQLLAHGHALTMWSAHVLQIMLTQKGLPTSLQEHVLNQLVRDFDREEAA